MVADSCRTVRIPAPRPDPFRFRDSAFASGGDSALHSIYRCFGQRQEAVMAGDFNRTNSACHLRRADQTHALECAGEFLLESCPL